MLLIGYPVLRTYGRQASFFLEQDMQVIEDAEKFGDTVIVTLRERMDVFNAPLLMKEFNQLLDEGAVHFIVDLSVVRIVDADGDYPLLHLLKRAQEVGGSVTLVCPPGNPIRVFYEMMRLDTLFDMVETLDVVLAKRELSAENEA
jgi:anti-anti-sigma factor